MRVLFVTAVVLLGCAAALWLWPIQREEAVRTHTTPAVATLPTSTPAPKELPTPAIAPATPSPPPRFTSSVMPGQPVARTTPRPTPRTPVTRPSAALPQAITQEPEGRRELDDVRSMLTNYRARIGENPVGDNAEIMQTIMGGNPARATLGPPHGQKLNDKGELVDNWGKPYFFHQISKTEMEVRSAGPDGQLYTSDDLVTK